MNIRIRDLVTAAAWVAVAVAAVICVNAVAHPLSNGQCQNLARIGQSAAKSRDAGEPEYEQQFTMGLYVGQDSAPMSQRIIVGKWAMRLVHRLYTDPDKAQDTPEQVQREVMIACLASWGDDK